MDRVAGQFRTFAVRTALSKPRSITLETATLAKFADGACTCSLGNTSVLVAAVSHTPSKPTTATFVPLTVEYKQKAAAAGRIPTTHLRRELAPSEKDILTSRIIDRSIRPLFSKGFNLDTQISCNILAVDGQYDPDVVAINGASASLAISDIPWNGPIGAVRVGLVGSNPIVHPSRRELENSRLNLVMSANKLGNVVMMDGSCKEPVLMPDLLKAMKLGIKECQSIIKIIAELQKNHGKRKRPLDLSLLPDEKHIALSMSLARDGLRTILSTHTHDKISRDKAMFEVRDQTFESMRKVFPGIDNVTLNEAFNTVVKNCYKQILIDTGIRTDGRIFDELRPITSKVDLYKPLHGSALFQRGQTQVFCSATFDSLDAAFRNDPLTSLISGIKEKNFMLHYEFPPYATNDISKFSAAGRREIGHGALAEKGIRPVVPANLDMTIRLNCEVLESNGSSSMASVCAGSLSLMDAGVEIKEHVAGVAMGLFLAEREAEQNGANEEVITGTTNEDIILTDILGFEDHFGEMDFKIAGTRRGITALQLDVKPTNGIATQTLYKAIQKAHIARAAIINKMESTIRAPREVKKENHPVIKTIHVPAHKRAKFIGFGGSNLKKLVAQIGVRISSFNEGQIDGEDSGNIVGAETRDNFMIFAPNKEAMEEAEEFIEKLLEKEYKEPVLEFNNIYTATIQEIRSQGLMVTLYPNMPPTLLPISQLDARTVHHPSALNFEVGQEIQVKYFGRDPASGQMRLSRKSLMISSIPRVRDHTGPPPDEPTPSTPEKKTNLAAGKVPLKKLV